MSETKLSKGQCVIVSGKAGRCAGEVVAVLTPGQLPPVPGFPDPKLVSNILDEFGIVQVAFIRHLHSGREVVFAANGDGKGNWIDMQRQKLTITAAGGPVT
jgi:hypothetical protein